MQTLRAFNSFVSVIRSYEGGHSPPHAFFFTRFSKGRIIQVFRGTTILWRTRTLGWLLPSTKIFGHKLEEFKATRRKNTSRRKHPSQVDTDIMSATVFLIFRTIGIIQVGASNTCLQGVLAFSDWILFFVFGPLSFADDKRSRLGFLFFFGFMKFIQASALIGNLILVDPVDH